MIMKSLKRYLLIVLATGLLFSCEQSEPAFTSRNGNVLTFSGREWDIKFSNDIDDILGPGNNLFTNHPNDVWVDENGHLHLAISKRGGKWRCTEVVSRDTMSYGTYIWTLQGNPVNIDPKIVLGLFTWDNNSFQTQANSEVDIEFAKWGDSEEEFTLQYGVQPIAFGPYFPERVDKPVKRLLEDSTISFSRPNWIGVSTHAFTWGPDLITWESWPGPEYGNGEPATSWTFDLNNPARVKNEGGNSSNPIIIPAPGNTTNARMNLWLSGGQGPNEGPDSKTRHEIIIEKFEYRPLP